METPEEKRARRLAKKEAKERKKREKMGWSEEYMGYTNADNPFGDNNLLGTFKLRERHQDVLRQKLYKLKQEQGVESEPLFPIVKPEPHSPQSQSCSDGESAEGPGTSSSTRGQEGEGAGGEGPSEGQGENQQEGQGENQEEKQDEGQGENQEEKPAEGQGEAVLTEEDLIQQSLDDYDSGRYSPSLLQNSDLPLDTHLVEPEEDLTRLQVARNQMHVTGDASESAEDAFVRRARQGMGGDEAQFSVEMPLTGKVYLWADKYRPRKPRFFNRVHTGFEWNKYNQTHYDFDNPPPKIVQGYKFNIFYPDLIDKRSTPQYFLEPSQDNRDFGVLRFHAGPPYEDIAFKIVNREWEYSHRHGFRCQFANGIFQLWFHFKRLRERHQDVLRQKLYKLKQEQGVESEPLFPIVKPEPHSPQSQSCSDGESAEGPGTSSSTRGQEGEGAGGEGPSEGQGENQQEGQGENQEEKQDEGQGENQEEKPAEGQGEAVLTEEDLIQQSLDDYDSGRYSPSLLQNSDLPLDTHLVEPEEDLTRLQVARNQMHVTGDASESAEDAFVRRARQGMGGDEAQFSVEMPLTGKVYLWADKYRPRKPRFFNRVHTGFEWNKYNQTHYDFDNPPPKIVQGYKFNIFYPDLIDKRSTPQYFLEPSQDNRDFGVLRFHAGPPYEDIAFKIVNREWEYSHRHGFRCQFANGIFQLWFHFKRYRYRR
ncbi:UNVERIFIED_CONTAM: hypothetical protein FKN15_016810 [Acipenser sinensis]